MALKNTSIGRAWYRAYCAAMLESDASKILERVESARKTIQDRAFELKCSLSANNPETNELDRAQRFLTMLLNCSATNDGNILLPQDGFRHTSRTFASAAQ